MINVQLPTGTRVSMTIEELQAYEQHIRDTAGAAASPVAEEPVVETPVEVPAPVVEAPVAVAPTTGMTAIEIVNLLNLDPTTAPADTLKRWSSVCRGTQIQRVTAKTRKEFGAWQQQQRAEGLGQAPAAPAAPAGMAMDAMARARAAAEAAISAGRAADLGSLLAQFGGASKLSEVPTNELDGFCVAVQQMLDAPPATTSYLS